VKWPGRSVIRELVYSGGDPAPGRGTVVIAGGCEVVGALAAFLERFVAVALEHQVGGAPDVDLGYHAENTGGLRSPNV
jgi:hypothetical protein